MVVRRSSATGDQTGSAHGGFFIQPRNCSAHAPRWSQAGIPTSPRHTPTGGGPWSSAAMACRCISMTGSGPDDDCAGALHAGISITTTTSGIRTQRPSALIGVTCGPSAILLRSRAARPCPSSASPLHRGPRLAAGHRLNRPSPTGSRVGSRVSCQCGFDIRIGSCACCRQVLRT